MTTTINFIQKSSAGQVIGGLEDSRISDDGTLVNIESNLRANGGKITINQIGLNGNTFLEGTSGGTTLFTITRGGLSGANAISFGSFSNSRFQFNSGIIQDFVQGATPEILASGYNDAQFAECLRITQNNARANSIITFNNISGGIQAGYVLGSTDNGMKLYSITGRAGMETAGGGIYVEQNGDVTITSTVVCSSIGTFTDVFATG